MVLIHLKWWSSSLRLHQVFPILIVQMLFPAPGPDFRKVGKFLLSCLHTQTLAADEDSDDDILGL